MAKSWFVTGALGCIGAWVVKTILDRGDVPVVFDLGGDPRRIRDVVDPAAFRRIRFVRGDVTDSEAVAAAVREHGVERIVHLAGLQVPFCQADPPAGARVNVVGTVNVFAAAKAAGIRRLAYASSAAVYGPNDFGPGGAPPVEDTACHPTTHYGVYKLANEGTARIYFQDDGISSVAIRPLTVYGVGRDQGMTSDPTCAMRAAVRGEPFRIRFSGRTDYQYVADCAAAFVAAADGGPAGAAIYNLHGESVDMAEVRELIVRYGPPGTAERITVEGPELPIPPALDGSAIDAAYPDLPRTPLAEGVRQTMERFRELEQGISS